VSDPMNPAGPQARVRPTTVTVSSYLLMAVAGLAIVSSVISLTGIATVSRVYRETYAGTSLEAGAGFAVGIVAVGVAIYLIYAAGLVVLALFNNRGRNPARIITWILGSISLCCFGFGLLGPVMDGFASSLDTGGGNSAEAQRRIQEALPSWQAPVSAAVAGLSLLAMVVALILLALPASNGFFRRPEAMMPPLQYPGQPYPGQPYPGQPYPGQAYPGQPYPGQAYPGQPYPGQQPFPGQQQYPGRQPDPGRQQQPGQADDANPPTHPATDPWQPPSDGSGPGETSPTDRPNGPSST
jgi:hypothetical protein